MSKKSAQEFVEKFYTNDEFIREFTLKGGLNSKATDEEKQASVMRVSKEMGYDFTKEEYDEAGKNFFEGKGVWSAIKIFAHLNKVAKKAEKERKKNVKHN